MFEFKRMLAVAKKEWTELIRDKFRVISNVLIPIFIMFLFASGMSMDLKNMPFVILDQDDTKLSREYSNSYINSPYFLYKGNVYSTEEAERIMKQGKIKFYIEIPSGFAKNVNANKNAQIATFVDGTMPIIANNIKGYVTATNAKFVSNQLIEKQGNVKTDYSSYQIINRYTYNQGSRSKYVFVPGTIAIILISMPAIMMTLSIVKEKESGSITNFYISPLSKLEYLIGKQLIYVFVYFFDFFILVGVAIFLYRVPMKGSLLMLSLLAFVYIFCTTALGLLISSFAKTQVSAVLIALITTMTPAFTFSGLIHPISSLDKGAQFMSRLYPILFFMRSIIGIFTKDLPISMLFFNLVCLIIFYALVISISLLLLKKQETH